MAEKNKKVNYSNAWFALAITRIGLGFVFLWAFMDKMFGLGISTPPAGSCVAGVSPTAGFLTAAGEGSGPFAGLFSIIAGQPWVDWLFMGALLGVGLALILGIGLRVAAVAGTALVVMMWAALLPVKSNPFIDDHIIYALIMIVFALSPRRVSLVNQWLAIPIVKKNPWLW
ncbi:MAG TPA: hypothetical protein PLZ58_03170 [Candidatus Saccharibacteria bacterium]|nr:hypothetical protein [Candidatus Saccharibacteria bacterium]HRQ06927.1 hypothetical protein [Candidatus Saccharibacteria bacterium]